MGIRQLLNLGIVIGVRTSVLCEGVSAYYGSMHEHSRGHLKRPGKAWEVSESVEWHYRGA